MAPEMTPDSTAEVVNLMAEPIFPYQTERAKARSAYEHATAAEAVGIHVSNQNFGDTAAMSHNQNPRIGANEMKDGRLATAPLITA